MALPGFFKSSVQKGVQTLIGLRREAFLKNPSCYATPNAAAVQYCTLSNLEEVPLGTLLRGTCLAWLFRSRSCRQLGLLCEKNADYCIEIAPCVSLQRRTVNL